MIVAGSTEFFAARIDLTRALPTRCALIFSPRPGMDAWSFGVRRLPDDVLRDTRAGCGMLVVSGETIMAQVPFVA